MHQRALAGAGHAGHHYQHAQGDVDVDVLEVVLPRPVDTSEVAQAYQAYLGVLDEQSAMDFEDVLVSMLAILTHYPDIATQVQRQYRHFTVDEFQDVSPVQFELLRAWLGGRDDVCVVGDPAQTIYSFTGATSTYLEDFDTHFPGARRIDLTHSYRSTPAIVALANAVMQGAARASAVHLDTTLTDGPAVALAECATDQDELRAHRERDRSGVQHHHRHRRDLKNKNEKRK